MEREESFGLYRYRWVVLGAFMLVGALVQVMWLNYAAITSTTGPGAARIVGLAQHMQV